MSVTNIPPFGVIPIDMGWPDQDQSPVLAPHLSFIQILPAFNMTTIDMGFNQGNVGGGGGGGAAQRPTAGFLYPLRNSLVQ